MSTVLQNTFVDRACRLLLTTPIPPDTTPRSECWCGLGFGDHVLSPRPQDECCNILAVGRSERHHRNDKITPFHHHFFLIFTLTNKYTYTRIRRYTHTHVNRCTCMHLCEVRGAPTSFSLRTVEFLGRFALQFCGTSTTQRRSSSISNHCG